ncbi:cAMP-binding domain of CRP or a regulatory subunit of cAMP-dependent protein kinases [Ekhidna lutea]|uniref:cAMP-binding domain of CRP or a regulatory subunit of cAMP-dependent protein kinases n=1 Tax=Ekhidna lutea TaxID=447679 RepID=A0A239KFF3_EKHLU|nr:Crp/Fnr family transcriptional regulator [Ekhidna lutea]SNT16359.1 cAMP-binding domain of CRP or a regulatory subunit of cAMP-dependent protein kinases [Ekhidna lutea]
MSAERNLWYFEDTDLFEVLCPKKTPDMENEHAPGVYKKDEFIYFKDQSSENIYMVSNGRVKIGTYGPDGKEIVKAILTRGEIFGELALAGEEKRQDFAQAMDADTRVCAMTIDDLQNLMKDNKELSFKILKIVGFRLRKMERKIESLVFKDARTRIVDFLREMAQEKGQKVGFEMMIKNHLTHKDIASLTGTSRQTVTTVMNELRDKNLITFDRRRILIRDLEKLA